MEQTKMNKPAADGFRLGLPLEDIKARTASLEEQLQKARRRELSETKQALRPRHVGASAERAREGLGSDDLPLKSFKNAIGRPKSYVFP